MKSPAFRRLLGLIAVAGLLLTAIAYAQQQQTLRRVGFFSAGTSESTADWITAFRQGMAQLGWNEGRDYIIDARYGNGVMQALPKVAAELLSTNPDIIVTTSESSIKVLAESTSTIPIVFGVANDPVKLGFAHSLQRPGRNVTGFTNSAPELGAKRLQLLKELAPRLKHVTLVFQQNDLASASQLDDIAKAASVLGLQVVQSAVRQATDLESAFKRGAESGTHGYILTTGPLFNIHRYALAQYVSKSKAPAVFSHTLYAEAGGLLSYSPSYTDNFRRAAGYVDKILKGVKATDLPIETPNKYELTVNLRTAKAARIAIPKSILLRADRIIE
ncbi:MAG TPA: ABC transporter substrate-binding protein [Burkholderiales bacterium]|jgi:putative ABC transport system substrate-binding protein